MHGDARALEARHRTCGDPFMPDLGALLWPRTVALIGASADAESLRGRILNVMQGHAFAGKLYPVSRSSAEVMGAQGLSLRRRSARSPPTSPSSSSPPSTWPEELERCGKAGVRSAVVLSSGFAESRGRRGDQMQAEIRAIAQRYDMAVMGPNSEGFANIAGQPLPHLQPGHGGRRTAARCRQGAHDPSWRSAAQSGGIGFAFFDHGRAKELSFRYIVTTGNEACLEALDFADFILDEGKTDALLLLLEDIKSAETFRRVAEKALRAGKPIIVNKIGQSDAGARAAASHTGGARRRLRRLPGDVPALRAHRGPRSSARWSTSPPAFSPGASGCRRAPRRHLHGLGRWRRLDGGRLCGGGPRGAASSTPRRAAHRCAPARPTAPRRTRSTPRRRRCPRSATRAWPSWCCPRRWSTASFVVMSARLPHGLERQREALATPRRDDAASRS